MTENEFTCIVCPKGCSIKVKHEDGKIISVDGNTCAKGFDYAVSEAINPVRILTSSVFSHNGSKKIPVRTAKPVPKDKLFEIMNEIKAVKAPANVKMGDVIIKNAAGTGIDVIATLNE